MEDFPEELTLEQFYALPVDKVVEWFAAKTGIDEERKTKLKKILERERKKDDNLS